MLNTATSSSYREEAESALIEGSRKIIESYFLKKLQDLKTKYQDIVEWITNFDSWRYGWVEFPKDESEFLIQYFDIHKWIISVWITEQDWSNITWRIADNLKTSMAFDQVSSRLASIDIKKLAQDFFVAHECHFSSEAFSFSAIELVDLVKSRVFEWLNNLLYDTTIPYLRFMKDEARKIEDELDLSVRKTTIGQYTPLQQSLLWSNTRHKMIDVSLDPSSPDIISMEFFNVPIAFLEDINWKLLIQFCDLNEDNPYNFSEEWAYSFVWRNKWPSFMAFFYWDPPYPPIDDFTHWANLETKTGPFKQAIISPEDIRKRFFEHIYTFAVNEEIGLCIIDQWKDIPGLWIPEIISFAIMTDEEIRAEKLKRDEVERRANKWALWKLLDDVIWTVWKVIPSRKSK
jgi:hypothetical protein